MENMTLAVALKKHCSLPGETLADFTAQFKNLTEKDKQDFREWFPAIGINIVEAKK